MRLSFISADQETLQEFFQRRIIFFLCVITLGQAYTPHGASMKKDVDDLMDYIEEMFRSRRKGGDDDEDEPDIDGILSHCSSLTMDPEKNRLLRKYGIRL